MFLSRQYILFANNNLNLFRDPFPICRNLPLTGDAQRVPEWTLSSQASVRFGNQLVQHFQPADHTSSQLTPCCSLAIAMLLVSLSLLISKSADFMWPNSWFNWPTRKCCTNFFADITMQDTFIVNDSLPTIFNYNNFIHSCYAIEIILPKKLHSVWPDLEACMYNLIYNVHIMWCVQCTVNNEQLYIYILVAIITKNFY